MEGKRNGTQVITIYITVDTVQRVCSLSKLEQTSKSDKSGTGKVIKARAEGIQETNLTVDAAWPLVPCLRSLGSVLYNNQAQSVYDHATDSPCDERAERAGGPIMFGRIGSG